MAYKVLKSGATVGTKAGVRRVLMEEVPAVNKRVYTAGQFVEEPIADNWADGIAAGDPEYTQWVIEVDEPVPTFDDDEVAAAVEASEGESEASIDEVLAQPAAEREAEVALIQEDADKRVQELQTDKEQVETELAQANDRIAQLEKDLEEATAPDAAQPGDPPASADPGAQDKQYDPSDHTVAQVQEYLSGASDEEKARVLAAERAGQNRAAFKVDS